MIKQELIQKAKLIMHKTYCNGITLNYDNITETDEGIKIFLDFLIPKKVEDESSENVFFLKLRNVGLIRLSSNGQILSKSSPEEFIKETIEKYKELLKRKEKIIIKIFSDYFIKLEQVHIALTPLRKVLRRFTEQDFLTDNLNKNFVKNEIRYINFLHSFGYLRKEGEKYTLDNETIKRLKKKIKEKDKEEIIEKIISCIFAEHFEYITYELNNTSVIPYIGILVTLCVLVLELRKNIKFNIDGLFKMYKEHYMCSQDKDGFEDKVIDMKKSNLLDYDYEHKRLSLPNLLYTRLITKFSSPEIQKQIC